MTSIHCSTLDRAMTCAGSLIPPEYPVDIPNDAGATGTAAHAALADVIGGAAPVADAIDAVLAADSAIDGHDLEYLVSEGLRAWDAISPGIPMPRCEAPLRARLCHGIADVIGYDDDVAAIVDWKTGYASDLHRWQLTGYAAGLVELMGRWPPSGHIRCIEVHVRHGRWHERHVTPRDLDMFDAELERRLRDPGQQWAPGRGCTYCPSRYECGSRRTWLRASASWLLDVDDLGGTRDTLAETYDKAEAIKSALERYWEAISSALDDGALPLPDGRVVEWAEARREEINAAAAWPILRDAGVDAGELFGIMRISKTSLRRIVEARAPRGEKRKVSEAILSRLRSAHAIQINLQQRRSVRVGDSQ